MKPLANKRVAKQHFPTADSLISVISQCLSLSLPDITCAYLQLSSSLYASALCVISAVCARDAEGDVQYSVQVNQRKPLEAFCVLTRFTGFCSSCGSSFKTIIKLKKRRRGEGKTVPAATTCASETFHGVKRKRERMKVSRWHSLTSRNGIRREIAAG